MGHGCRVVSRPHFLSGHVSVSESGVSVSESGVQDRGGESGSNHLNPLEVFPFPSKNPLYLPISAVCSIEPESSFLLDFSLQHVRRRLCFPVRNQLQISNRKSSLRISSVAFLHSQRSCRCMWYNGGPVPQEIPSQYVLAFSGYQCPYHISSVALHRD